MLVWFGIERTWQPMLFCTMYGMALVGFFAVFHGHAHGAEMPAGASGVLYAVGFVGATAMLHAVGVGIGLLVGREGGTLSQRLVQGGGGAMALFGLAALPGFLL